MPREERFPDFIETLPEAEMPVPGARGRLLQAGGMQVVFVEYAQITASPEHTHGDQWEFVLAGDVSITIGGRRTRYRAGDNFLIRAGVPHRGEFSAGYRGMMVFNAPDRYRAR